MIVRCRLCKLELLFLLSAVAIFFTTSIASGPLPNLHAVYVHPDWSSDETSESTFERMARFGINAIFVDVYGPTGIGKGAFLMEKKGPWTGKSEEPEFAGAFSLEKTVERAQKSRISVHVTISCFGGLVVDPRNELHQAHLREVVEYVLMYFPALDGVHLDYVRYLSERGLNAKGDTDTITMFVKSIREAVRGKALSAAVIATGDQEEYDAARFDTGQDCRALSQYLDFICPMAYHLAFGKRLEWVGSVSRFTRSISRESCRVFPTVQAYYEFEKEIALSHRMATNISVPGPAFEVPSIGILQFDVNWESLESRFSLSIRDSFFREVATAPIVNRTRHQRGETYVLVANTTGMWETELRVHAIGYSGEKVTVHVSDVNEELPGYQVLQGAISMIMTHADGFCVFALNNLSSEELRAVGDCLDKPLTHSAFDVACAIVIDYEYQRDPLKP